MLNFETLTLQELEDTINAEQFKDQENSYVYLNILDNINNIRLTLEMLKNIKNNQRENFNTEIIFEE